MIKLGKYSYKILEYLAKTNGNRLYIAPAVWSTLIETEPERLWIERYDFLAEKTLLIEFTTFKRTSIDPRRSEGPFVGKVDDQIQWLKEGREVILDPEEKVRVVAAMKKHHEQTNRMWSLK